jgi:hypothetical protein
VHKHVVMIVCGDAHFCIFHSPCIEKTLQCMNIENLHASTSVGVLCI